MPSPAPERYETQPYGGVYSNSARCRTSNKPAARYQRSNGASRYEHRAQSAMLAEHVCRKERITARRCRCLLRWSALSPIPVHAVHAFAR